MAAKYWSERNPIGEIVRVVDPMNHAPLDLRVVGVAEDAPINEIGEMPQPYMYIPFHLINFGEVTFVVQTGPNAMSIAKNARNALIPREPPA